MHTIFQALHSEETKDKNKIFDNFLLYNDDIILNTFDLCIGLKYFKKIRKVMS